MISPCMCLALGHSIFIYIPIHKIDCKVYKDSNSVGLFIIVYPVLSIMAHSRNTIVYE